MMIEWLMHKKPLFGIIPFLFAIAVASAARASSDAGIDVTVNQVQVRVLYSVAVDFGKAEDCISNPSCLLFDIVDLLQNPSVAAKTQHEVLQFELYQRSNESGIFLSLVRDPFERGDYKKLFDGRAETDLKRQILSLLERHLKMASGGKGLPADIRLYKCMAKDCNDILFGAFPSDEMHSGYCATQGNGCDVKPTSVKRDEMKKYFQKIQ